MYNERLNAEKLEAVFDEFWEKIPGRAVLDGTWLSRGVMVGVEILPDDDIRMGIFSPDLSGVGEIEYYDDDPDPLRNPFRNVRNPHLAENQKAVVDRILFQTKEDRSRFDILADVTVMETIDGGSSWRKRMQGRFSLLSFDDAADVSRFLRMAKDALARRKRPVVIVSDVDDII